MLRNEVLENVLDDSYATAETPLMYLKSKNTKLRFV